MQQRFDETTGYFNDVPYFSPVETTVFYEAVRNCRLHKLPGHLMVNPRSIPFFVKPGTLLTESLENNFQTATGTRTKSASAVLPEFMVDFSSAQPLLKSSGSDFVTIKEACGVLNSDVVGDATGVISIQSLDASSIDRIWTNLLLSLNNCSSASSRFSVKYVDIPLTQSSDHCECLLSLLLAGIASILHFYSQKKGHQAALESVTIEFVVLSTTEGASVADKIQYYAENKLKLSVKRCCENDFDSFQKELVSGAQLIECCETDWLENVCNEVVDAHEMLCDQDVEQVNGKLVSPLILIVVPYIEAARSALTAQILDSYSSEPLRVQSERSWSFDELSKPSPVAFFCSSTWLTGQMLVPDADRLMHRLNVRVVIHGGFCEVANVVEEEFVRCTTALQMCGVTPIETKLFQLQTPSYFRNDVKRNAAEVASAAQVCGTTLLLLFRRFVLRFSPSSRQPYTTFPRDLFFSQRSWEYFNYTVRTLRSAGIVAPVSDVSSEAVELSVLGRFLSFRFRIGDVAATLDPLTLADGKAILWAFLLRQPLSVLRDVLKQSHTFHSWVDAAVTSFCKEHDLTFSFLDTLPRKALIEQLAHFGFGESAVKNRVHYLLSSPSGRRFPLRPHLVGAVPTVCRGWYEQAPLNAGLSLEKKEVSVVCLPPKAMYCEMEAAEKASTFQLQCPLELSYPVLVAHSVFHISLHNICVFSETAEPNIVMPLPVNILESGVMHFLMSGIVKANTGLWLDGIMNEITPAASDSSVLAPLFLKGRLHIQYCEREVFTRKKRRMEPTYTKNDSTETFTGAVPRTAAERSAVEELVELIQSIGREKAEKAFRGKKGFNFLDVSHEFHPFYLHTLKKAV